MHILSTNFCDILIYLSNIKIAEFFGSSSPQIIFDEIDFYCFVEYYKSDEIRELIQKYKITSIKFNKIEIIEEAIENIINYYDKILLKQTTKIELDACELKIKNFNTIYM